MLVVDVTMEILRRCYYPDECLDKIYLRGLQRSAADAAVVVVTVCGEFTSCCMKLCARDRHTGDVHRYS